MAGLISTSTLLLHASGVMLEDIALALGFSKSYVSYMLRGERRPHPSLIPVIRALAGPDIASEIEQLLDVEEVASVA